MYNALCTQDVFEMRYAKAPEDTTTMSTDEPSTPGRDDLSSDFSPSDYDDDLDEDDDSEEEREKRLKEVTEQVPMLKTVLFQRQQVYS